MGLDFTSPATFQDSLVPADARLAGWAAIAHALGARAPVRTPACVSDKHVKGGRREEGAWRVFDKRFWLGDTLADHLAFALKHEDIDLLVLKRIFDVIPAGALEDFVRTAPTSASGRRLWFFYEWLTGSKLDLPDAAQKVTAVDALDPKAQFTGAPRLSRRHRVRDNLLGVPAFCPTIRRTEALERFVALGLDAKARATVGRVSARLVARAASFLLLADSRASFEIEGERPPRGRLERWGRAVMQAGRNPLSLAEIERLHRVLIEDTRFITPGLRTEGVFLGERDQSGDPLPEHIGARPEDLPSLVEGLIQADARMSASGVDPVLQAAATAFGFVDIHPLQDGNGRLHRCLVHHVLAERGFTPPGMIFPVSSVMLDRIDDYRATLQAHSAPLMPFIDWRPTASCNVEALGDTADLYRYFDCTEAAEFLYACVERTVEQDLPREIDYLRRHDVALRRVMDAVEMPDRLAESLIMFIRQNRGALPKGRRQKEFAALSDGEVTQIEAIVGDAFAGFDGPA